MRGALGAMIWKEFVQMRRDRFTLAMLIGIPAIQLALFGYAIQTEVRHLPTLVLDEARSAESRSLVQTLENTGNFDIIGIAPSRAAIRRTIERGDARAAIVVPPTYTRDLKRGHTATAQVIVDAADPLASSAAISGASLAGLRESQRLATATTPIGARPPPLDLRVRPWYNPTLETPVFIVPGIIGVLLSLTMVLVTSMAVVRERERGTLEQLVVTPIGKTSLMLGKIVPFLLVGYVQITIILLLGRLLFDVPVRGSLALLYAMALPFIVANLALGLLLSTLVKTQAQAMQLGFLFLLPNILLSGFMFPREAMPAPAQWLGALLPLTYFLDVLRGLLLKGVGLGAVWPEMAWLIGFSLAFMTATVVRFHKRVD